MMHGLEARKEAELRETSIKGVLRYWWRAVHGNTYRNAKDLLHAEATLFGGTNPKLKSPLFLKITNENVLQTNAKMLPHRAKSFSGKAFQKNGSFDLELSIPPHFDLHKLEPYTSIFELTVLLGSFGQRTRRGFGSVQVHDFADEQVFLEKVTKLLTTFDQKPEIG